jgi:hypothetical protein
VAIPNDKPKQETADKYPHKGTSFAGIFITIGQLIPLTHPPDAVRE